MYDVTSTLYLLLSVHRKFLSLIFCCKVEECYIRTESGIISSTRHKKGTAGIPLTNIKIVREKPDDKKGEIWVSGPNVAEVSSWFLQLYEL